MTDKVKLLFLDDDPGRVPMLPRSVDLHYVRTPNEFVDWLKTNGTPDIISFDHDLAPEHYEIGYTSDRTGNGADCARWAIENGFVPKRIHIHSWNATGAKRILGLFQDAGVDATVVIRPFNPHKPHLWTEG